AFVITLDADPGNRAAAGGLVGSGNADVVFGAAGRHAGFTARATVQIHGHSPTMCHRIPFGEFSKFPPFVVAIGAGARADNPEATRQIKPMFHPHPPRGSPSPGWPPRPGPPSRAR